MIDDIIANGTKTPDELRKDADELYSQLNDSQKEKISQILDDPKRLRALLDSPTAREILKRLKKGE